MKAIKFDLPIDGTKVRTIEELREHFSTEILDLYKNGLLLKWLINQRYPSYAQAVERLLPTETDANLLKLLCGIFEVDVDFDIIQQLADYHGSGIKIDPEQLQYKQKYEESRAQAKGKIISFDDEFIGSSVDMETIIKIHKFHTGEDIILVPVLGDLHITNFDFKSNFGNNPFDFFKKLYKYNKGDRIDIGSNLFGERFEAIAPCDGVLYKKVFPVKSRAVIKYYCGHFSMTDKRDIISIWEDIINYYKETVIAYLQINI